MLLVAAFAYMIGWVYGDELAAARMPKNNSLSSAINLHKTCSEMQLHRAQLKETAQRPERRPQAYHSLFQKPSKSPPAKPHKINGRIHPIRPFQKVWVTKQR